MNFALINISIFHLKQVSAYGEEEWLGRELNCCGRRKYNHIKWHYVLFWTVDFQQILDVIISFLTH